MMVKDFKKTRAQRTAARKAGHKARVETKWAKHEPPFTEVSADRRKY